MPRKPEPPRGETHGRAHPGHPFGGPHTGDRLHVLVVGRDPAASERLAALIGAWGHEPLAADVDQAPARAREWLPDVVLLDVRLAAGLFRLARRLQQATGPVRVFLAAEVHGPGHGFSFYALSPWDPAVELARLAALQVSRSAPPRDVSPSDYTI
jgi:CheY-like chemotaxis protein